MTKSQRSRDSAVVRSSVTPSANVRVLRIVAEVRERQDHDRRPVRQWQSWRSRRGSGQADVDPKYLQWVSDVFQALLTHISVLGVDLTLDLFVCGTRQADSAGFSNSFESRSDIDTIAQNVIALDQHLAEIDADAV